MVFVMVVIASLRMQSAICGYLCDAVLRVFTAIPKPFREPA